MKKKRDNSFWELYERVERQNTAVLIGMPLENPRCKKKV